MTREEVKDFLMEHYVPAGVIGQSVDVMHKNNVELVVDIIFADFK